MSYRFCWLRACALGVVVLGMSLISSPAAAVEVGWTFDNAALTPEFNDHTTTMVYLNGATTSDVVDFGTASGFGLQAMPGGDAKVMSFPAFSNAQGLALYDLGHANGLLANGSPALYINRYTMAWDILVPNVNFNWFSFYQTTADNTATFPVADGDFFIRPTDGGIGIIGDYHSSIPSNEWHRVVMVIDASALDPETLQPRSLTMDKYIDGMPVGTTILNSPTDFRWSMYTDDDVNPPPTADAFILTDNDGDTNAGYISAFYYTDRVVDATTIMGWGGPKAFGLPGPGDVNFDGAVDIFDINLVSSNWSGAGPTGDANHDGTVDIFDINLISSNWSPPGGAAAAVPEPAAWLLAVVGLACLMLNRRAVRRWPGVPCTQFA